jgi:hypothetical protein
MKRIEFIVDWKLAIRFYSIHAMLIFTILGLIEAVLWGAHIQVPSLVMAFLNVIIGISGIVGRLVKQDPGDAARIAELQRGVAHEQ